jgi:hypothetical protein
MEFDRHTSWGPDHRSLVDAELLLQGQVLEGELAVAAEEEGESRNRWSRSVIIELR